ncbi:MAG: ABC transporter permease [Gammaproteobacteria bacterium]|nr:ABC transporter permease [Gammaproteobacteria bacterium]
MSETDSIRLKGQSHRASHGALFLPVAWRNLWRNRRRTFLTVGAIAFGMLIVQVLMSIQSGSYGPMIALATRMGSGHIQILHESFHDEPRIEYAITNINDRLNELDRARELEGVTARAEAFALVSNDPHTTAALVNGVIPERELAVSDWPTKVVKGSYLTGENQALIGAVLARNLQLDVGGEIVILGTNADGGIGAAVAEICGIFEGTTELERAVIQIDLGTFQEAFDMPDQAHRIVALVDDPMSMDDGLAALEQVRVDGEVLMDWTELMPEISEGIEIDIVSNAVLQFVLILIVVLSIMNTFVMTLFERTREYGVMFAIGTKRILAYRMTLIEVVLLWIVGVICGGLLTCLLVGPLMYTGIVIPVSEDAIQSQFAFMPTAIYPDFSWWVIFTAPAAIGIGAVISVSLVAFRLTRLDITEALRSE